MNTFTHYLQVEGVNIYSSVNDTSQLSTVRGGSLLLKLAVDLLGGSPAGENQRGLESVSKFQDKLNALESRRHVNLPPFQTPPPALTKKLTPITTGASSGIYGITEGEPEDIIKAIRKYLSEHDYFRHFTFTLVVEPANGQSFATIKERLIARTRQAQMRQPSVAPPPVGNGRAAVPCRLQGLLPADSAMALPPKDLKERTPKPNVAASCQNRFYFGRYAKFALYEMEIQALRDTKPDGEEKDRLSGILDGLRHFDPAESIDEIADQPYDSPANNPWYPQLRNKIAVIYFDGNGFSGIQRDQVRTTEDQRAFDERIKTYRRELLAALVGHWLKYPHWISDTDGTENTKRVLPLETLLWGGDEMIFVVPASRGLELVQFFYRHSQGWTSQDDGGERLTHAGGIVFCHYKTPIGRATRLARDLADAVKEKPYGRKGNYFDTVVLESIDYPAESLEEFFRKRYGAVARHRFPLQPALPPTGDESSATETPRETLAQALQNLLVRGERTCPKSQAYGIARAALKADWPPAASKAEPGEQAQLRPSSRKRDDGSIEKFASAFHQELWRFKQLQNPGSADAGDTPPATDTTLPAAGSPDAPAQTSAGALPDLKKLLWDDLLRPPAPLANSEAEPAAPGADPPDPVPLARWQWLHLVELWDYLAPVRDEKTAPGQGTGTPAGTDPATETPA